MKTQYNSQVMASALIASTAIVSASTDYILPSLPMISQSLQCSIESTHNSILFSMIGGLISIVLIGPISDSISRYKLYICSLALSAAFSFLSSLSPSIEALNISRFGYGMFASTAHVLPYIMILENFNAEKIKIYFSLLISATAAALISAPILSGLTIKYLGWERCFDMLGCALLIVAIILAIWGKESDQKKAKMTFSALGPNYLKVIKDWQFVKLSAIPAIMIGSVLFYLINAPFYFIQVKHFNSQQYSIAHAIVLAGSCVSSGLATKCVNRFTNKGILLAGCILAITGSLIAFMGSKFSDNLMLFGMMVYASAGGFTTAIYVALALSRQKACASYATSVYAIIKALFVMSYTACARFVIDSSMSPSILVIIFSALCATILYASIRKLAQEKRASLPLKS